MREDGRGGMGEAEDRTRTGMRVQRDAEDGKRGMRVRGICGSRPGSRRCGDARRDSGHVRQAQLDQADEHRAIGEVEGCER
jgi:hypothetical protein